MNVAELMTRNPVRLRPDERLDIAVALMVSCRFRHLPVEEHGRLVGILSLHDLYAADLSHEAVTVMSSPVITISSRDSWSDAANLLATRPISCLPVVDQSRLVGIVSATNFLSPAISLLEQEGRDCCRPIPVAALMTPEPIATLQANDHLDLSHTLMTVHRVRHLPVLDGERLVGMVSDHDLLRAEAWVLQPPGQRLQTKAQLRVRDVMTTRVATIDSESLAADAGRMLLRRRFGALPVVSGHKRVGMLSVRDFFHHLLSLSLPEAKAAAR